MALRFHPKIGDVLICAFPDGLRAPEMTKIRPVVVVTRQHKGRPSLCTVVPLSTTAPDPVMDYHVRINEQGLPRSLRSKATWAKCDMLYTFCLDRLDRVKCGKDGVTGQRIYETGRIGVDEIAKVRKAIAFALGLGP
jgi:mRNA interferase MazF